MSEIAFMSVPELPRNQENTPTV
jgi:hypothetical protein